MLNDMLVAMSTANKLEEADRGKLPPPPSQHLHG
jgi:hypothetical protein